MKIKENISLKPFTVFQIGGPARFFLRIKTRDELKEGIEWAVSKRLPFYILGLGSNLLVSDSGFDGLVLRPEFSKISIDGNSIITEAGAKMAEVVSFALKNGLVGFEWAVGVPGTVGGSIRGNAGCFGSEMKNHVQSVLAFNANKLDFELVSNESCNFGYRDSMFKKRPDLIICSAYLKLKSGNILEARRHLAEFLKVRGQGGAKVWREFFSEGGNPSSQEVGAKTAGSVFKNVLWARKDVDMERLFSRFPKWRAFENNMGIPAGYLIDEAGLKGTKIGGAMVSNKHANFIINNGSASAEEIVTLISLIKERIHTKFGIQLEEEIQYIGFKNNLPAY